MHKSLKASSAGREEDLRWTRAAGSRGPWIHNLVAVLFGLCLLSGLVLGSGLAEGVVGHREFFREAHVVSGLAALVLGLGAMSRFGGSSMVGMARELRTWLVEDQAWFDIWRSTLRRPAHGRSRPNAGQKVAYSTIAASMVVLAVTGLVLRFFSYFPLWLRSGATLSHTLFFYFLTAVILAHIGYAFASRRRD